MAEPKSAGLWANSVSGGTGRYRHSMSPFGRLDAELCIPRSGYLSDDNSHPLSHDTSGGGQLMQSQTAWVPYKLFSSPVHIMANSVINSMTGRGLYGLVKPLLMWTHDIKKACVKEKVPLQKAIVTQGYSESNEKTQGLICHSASLGLNCDLENMVKRSQRSGEVAHILELHRIFQLPNLENMATVYWIRYACLCVIGCQDVRLPDERHACWKKR